MKAPIFIASDKDGGIDDSEAAMMRACHLSGQIEADQAVAHYLAGELPIGTKQEPTDWPLIGFLVAFGAAFAVILYLSVRYGA